MFSRAPRFFLCGLVILLSPTRAPAQASSPTPPPDFLLSLLRFGVECRRAALPRSRYLGDETRFAVTVERSGGGPPPMSAATAADGGLEGGAAAVTATTTVRTTYRAFYRDLVAPVSDDNSVLLQCRAGAKCIAGYRDKGIERLSRLRLATCSSRTATLVVGAARVFIEGGRPSASGAE